jgi:hypothetical protein
MWAVADARSRAMSLASQPRWRRLCSRLAHGALCEQSRAHFRGTRHGNGISIESMLFLLLHQDALRGPSAHVLRSYCTTLQYGCRASDRIKIQTDEKRNQSKRFQIFRMNASDARAVEEMGLPNISLIIPFPRALPTSAPPRPCHLAPTVPARQAPSKCRCS